MCTMYTLYKTIKKSGNERFTNELIELERTERRTLRDSR